MVLKKFNKNHLLTPISILGLVILLIFSSCSIRNTIQSALHIPITEVSNKSKTSLSSTHCSSFEDISFQNTISKIKKHLIPILKLDVHAFLIDFKITVQKFEILSDKICSSKSEIPYYILYKNFKVYLN